MARETKPTDDKMQGRSGGGDSGGGAYPNPHTGKGDGDGGGGSDGFMGHGGQSEMPYHGKGQLGEKKVGDNANAPTRETGAED
ncbi:MAG: hypothetical protein QOH81_2507 [Sphingomonadales bacterium]|jgi:hypothetical protein|nr:hypothetical protein [Sphingomonadales bacterium]